MDQQTSDQGWQQLQAHIEGFFLPALRIDVQRIDTSRYLSSSYWRCRSNVIRTNSRNKHKKGTRSSEEHRIHRNSRLHSGAKVLLEERIFLY